MDSLPLPDCNGKTTFIYALVDPNTSQIRYVGKSDNPQERYKVHTQRDKSDTHKTRWLRSLAKNGQKPELQIIEEIPLSEWGERECYWIAFYRKQGMPLTNSVEGGRGVIGYVPTPEHRAKMSATMTGRKHTDEARQNMSNAQRGLNKRLSKEQRVHISEIQKGKPFPFKVYEANRKRLTGVSLPDATKQKISETKRRKGYSEEYRANVSQRAKNFSQEHKEKLRIARHSKPESFETRARMSMAHKGKPTGPMSDETKEKLSMAHKGKPKKSPSAETRAKLSAANKGKVNHVPTPSERESLSLLNKGNKNALGHKMSDDAKARSQETRLLNLQKEENQVKHRENLKRKRDAVSHLSYEQAAIVKYNAYNIPQQDYVKMFKISPSVISNIVHGRSYKHVTREHLPSRGLDEQ